MDEFIIEFRNITKKFSRVVANANVNLSIKKGEIHGIIGENGAGKSTLMKILYGLLEPTEGEILLKGKKIDIASPAVAIRHGIGMVHQHFMLLPSLSIAENIVLGSEPRKKKIFMDRDKAIDITEDLVKRYGLKVNPYSKVEEVSVGIQQRVEILKVLHKGADILILDEPTAVLTPQETEELFAVIRKLVQDLNKTVIIITHKLQEVMALSDRVSVMRHGKLIGTLETKTVTEQILAEMMVGREMLFSKLDKKQIKGKTLLEIMDLKIKDKRGLNPLKSVSLKLNAGEILGIAGVEGNGQSELVEALTGLQKVDGGKILVGNKLVTGKSPKEIRNLGIAHVPEDRLATGLSTKASITENMMMGRHNKEPYAKKGFHIYKKPIRRWTEKLINEFDIRTPNQDILTEDLSGGNMQKLVIAREFSFDTPILIISQPTRGVDIGAIEFIHKEIIKKRNKGCGILLVSADLDEIFRLADRIITIYEGQITGEFAGGEISKREIGLFMTGRHDGLRKGGYNG